MVMVTIGTSPTTLIKANKKRKTLSITNSHNAAIAYIDDKAGPTSTNAKWILYPRQTLILLKADGDFPERNFFAVSDTASTIMVVGFQNEAK